MSTGLTIRLLHSAADADALGDHLARHHAESGTDGRPVFSPSASGSTWSDPEKKAFLAAKWSRAIGDREWERSFGAFADGRQVGHSDLRSRGLPSCAHRALLGLGVEAAHYRKGIGRALLDEALRHAREETALDWIDLGVFANNPHAHRMYVKAGFVETGRVNDLFRVHGHSIDDIQMTLRLRS